MKGAADVRKRINITLPEETVALLDRVTDNRSRLIEEAVLQYVATRGVERLRERLAEGYTRRAKHDLAIAEEWYPLEEDVWQESR